mmetsp:Transcript_4954/g.10940  ORF Transcript_4954/g.10940 Transcript_4954/m.10940 type:complete len:112 (+) Transcript_4954:21-356(+)
MNQASPEHPDWSHKVKRWVDTELMAERIDGWLGEGSVSVWRYDTGVEYRLFNGVCNKTTIFQGDMPEPFPWVAPQVHHTVSHGVHRCSHFYFTALAMHANPLISPTYNHNE